MTVSNESNADGANANRTSLFVSLVNNGTSLEVCAGLSLLICNFTARIRPWWHVRSRDFCTLSIPIDLIIDDEDGDDEIQCDGVELTDIIFEKGSWDSHDIFSISFQNYIHCVWLSGRTLLLQKTSILSEYSSHNTVISYNNPTRENMDQLVHNGEIHAMYSP